MGKSLGGSQREELAIAQPRRVYRLVSELDPPESDFRAQSEERPPYADPELQRRAEEVSVWDRFERAEDLARKRPGLRFVAVLEVPRDVRLRPGKRGHWGIPKGIAPDEIKRWVVEVVALP